MAKLQKYYKIRLLKKLYNIIVYIKASFQLSIYENQLKKNSLIR